MTKEEQIAEWMISNPVIRFSINGEIVEITGDDRLPYFSNAYDETIISTENYANSRQGKRAALRQQWEALPAYIRGPYRPEFEAANRLLDEGDDESAIAMIQYAIAKIDFTQDQIAVFDATKQQMIDGIANLPSIA